MDIRPIRSEDDLTWALDEIERYFDEEPSPGTLEADRFDVLTVLIAAYETRWHDIPAVEPAAVLRYAIDELGHTQAELSAILGSRSRASEILAGRRPMTTEMIGKVSAAWHIPVAAFFPTGRSAEAA